MMYKYVAAIFFCDKLYDNKRHSLAEDKIGQEGNVVLSRLFGSLCESVDHGGVTSRCC